MSFVTRDAAVGLGLARLRTAHSVRPPRPKGRAAPMPARAVAEPQEKERAPASAPAAPPTLRASPDVAYDRVLRSPAGDTQFVDPSLRDDGGPPRFFSPFIPGHTSSDPSALPLIIYLPGIDGTGYAASRQFPRLAEEFDLRCFFTPAGDRTPFQSLIDLIIAYLSVEVDGQPSERPVYILGESFGAVLAFAAAAACPTLVDRVVIVNPATSFPRSAWPRLGPLLAAAPREVYSAAPFALSLLISNPVLMAGAQIDPTRNLFEQLPGAADRLMKQLGLLGRLADILPGETLQWKLRLMEEGSAAVEGLYGKVQQRVLLLVSDGDWLIPSAEEGPRLKRKLPRAALRVLQGHSHAALQESGLDLMAILQQEGFYTRRRALSTPLPPRRAGGPGVGYGQPDAPIELPTQRELEKDTDGFINTLQQLVSPVFLSTRDDGSREMGLGALPTDRPIVFVGNHQLLATDMYLMQARFLRELGRLPRGLAHPAVMGGAITAGTAGSRNGSGGASTSGTDGGRGDQSAGFASFLLTYGAVSVSGRSFHKLLARGEDVLLFPGGVREAYHNKGEAYRIFWPDKPEFVRMAAKFGATIVPFGAVGSADSLNLVADSREMRDLPLVGQRLQQLTRDMPTARRGDTDETFVAPLALPGVPDRFYFLFGKPIRTSPDDLKDTTRVAETYEASKAGVEGAIAYLLRERERDPYRQLLPRLLYEATWGGRKQAPTFDYTRD